MVKVEINTLLFNINKNAPIIILKDRGGRVLPIIIGIFEAQAILLFLEKTKFPRPLTHDLLKNTVEALGGKLVKLEIYGLKENTYFANLIFALDGKHIKLDCRPSDGIALALRAGVSIFASEDLLEFPEIIKHYEGEGFIKSGALDKPIDKKEADEFRKSLEKLSAYEFWKILKEEK